MKVAVLLFMFVVLGSLLIVSNNELSLSEEGDFRIFSGLWAGWIGDVFSDIGSVIEDIISEDWTSG